MEAFDQAAIYSAGANLVGSMPSLRSRSTRGRYSPLLVSQAAVDRREGAPIL